MSNTITPLTNVDFTASLAELKPYLEDRIIAMPSAEEWSDIYYLMVTGEDLPVTSNTLAELNLTLMNIVYIETQGGQEYYQGTTPNSCIVLSVEEIESRTINAYSAPHTSSRLPDYPNGYYPDDCTLIQGHSVDEPVFLSCVLEDAELVYSFRIPEGEVYKSFVIFVNEDTVQVN